MPIDKNRYPPDWAKRAHRIKERDNWTCWLCGARHLEIGVHLEDGTWTTDQFLIDQAEKPIKAIMTVAHLDHDETNWEVEDARLATLCAVCHLKYDAADNATRRAYGKEYRDNQLEFEFDF